VAGETLPTPAQWEALLRRAWSPGPPFHVVRSAGDRAIVEVEHAVAARARAAWNVTLERPGARLATVRTWGTLVGAKAWLRQRERSAE
jgi:hypothetical protein